MFLFDLSPAVPSNEGKQAVSRLIEPFSSRYASIWLARGDERVFLAK